MHSGVIVRKKEGKKDNGEGDLLLNLDSNVHLVLFHPLQKKKTVKPAGKS